MFLTLKTPDASPLPADLTLMSGATGEALHARRAYRVGDVVFRFEGGELRSRRDQHTVELRNGRHLFHPVLAMTAHGCEPNCCVDLHNRLMVVVRPTAIGEVITFDYETTESWFSHPFWCLCGSRRCRGRIG